jgi:phosphoribosyl 1,2-cyclic phosphodiesterase
VVNVTFYGVRGSTPCPSPGTARYGGNTACVVADRPGDDPIVFDLGTGLRLYGETVIDQPAFRGHAFVSHLHWDHVQGLPFFRPILRADGELVVYGPPAEEGETLEESFAGFMRPPYFPVTVEELLGDITFRDLPAGGSVTLGDATIHAFDVPHVGITNGYRLDWDGTSVAYVSDHQQPVDGSFGISDAVVESCRGVDLLIHDAQYTTDEFVQKCDWGHCTVEYAVAVAAAAEVERLALFHHDPLHDDATLDCLLSAARHLARDRFEVVAAYEGLTVALS